jgi:hypothetical protein
VLLLCTDALLAMLRSCVMACSDAALCADTALGPAVLVCADAVFSLLLTGSAGEGRGAADAGQAMWAGGAKVVVAAAVVRG